MSNWMEEVEKAFKTNSDYVKREKKKIIAVLMIGVILFVIAFIVDIYLNDNVSSLMLMGGLLAIMIAFFMQLSMTTNNPVDVGIYLETFYYINKLLDKLRIYNEERIFIEKEKIKKEIVNILRNLEEKSNTYSSWAKTELYPEFSESISKTIKEFIYKIDFAVSNNIKISEELLNKLEKLYTEHVNVRNKKINEHIDINNNIISVFAESQILDESKKISGSETLIEKISIKMSPPVKFAISTILLLIFIWLFFHFLVPLVYSIGDDTRLIVIFAAWGTFTYILYNSYFKKRL